MRRLLAPLLVPPVLLMTLLVPATPAEAAGPYRWSAKPISAELAKRMHWSYRSGCPVPLRDLRYLLMTYHGFDGVAHTGEMVVHKDVVIVIANSFDRMYQAGFQIRRMRLVDDFQGSDDRSMAADNTSAFNCRKVEGTSRWSLHAYGKAVDINPIENPYVDSTHVDPPAGAPYATRTPYRRGMVSKGVVAAFASHGWGWGGNFRNAKDYQHFSSTGS